MLERVLERVRHLAVAAHHLCAQGVQLQDAADRRLDGVAEIAGAGQHDEELGAGRAHVVEHLLEARAVAVGGVFREGGDGLVAVPAAVGVERLLLLQKLSLVARPGGCAEVAYRPHGTSTHVDNVAATGALHWALRRAGLLDDPGWQGEAAAPANPALDAGDGTMGRLLADTEMAAQLEVLLFELAALLEDIRENPDRYVRISIF